MAFKEYVVNVKEVKSDRKWAALNQYLVMIIIDVMAMSVGITVGWISPVLLLLRSQETPLEAPITTEEMSWIGSIHLLLAMPGVLLYGYLLNTLGRKTSAYLISIPIMMHWIILIFSTNATYVIIARVFAGIGSGGVYSVLPVYVAEIAEDRIRGRLGASVSLCSYSGFMISFIACPRLSFYTMSYVLIVPSIMAFLAALLLGPETPVFLLKQNKSDEARNTLRWLRGVGRKDKSLNEEIENEFERLKASAKTETPNISYKDLVSPLTLKGLLISITILVIQQLSTVFALISYVGTVFQQSGSSFSSNDSTIVVGLLLIIGACCSSYLVEKAGRRILLIGSCLSVCVCLMTLGTYTYIKTQGYNVDEFTWIPILSLALCFFCFSCGLGPLPFVVVSEMFSPKIRGTAAQICVFMFWFSSFIIVKFFNAVKDNLGMPGCFWLFGSCMIFGATFIYFLLPETKGRRIEDILIDLAGGKKIQDVNV